MPDISPDGFIYPTPGRRVDPQSGQTYVREEDPAFRTYIDYFGYSPEQAAAAMGYDPNDQNTWGRWVPGTDQQANFGKILGEFIAMGALGGLGGGYLGAATGLTGAGAGGAAGGTAAGTTAAATVPSLGIAGGTALPSSLIAGTAVPGFAAGGTAAGIGTGATVAGTGSGIGGGGATAAAAPTVGATGASTAAPAGFTGVGGTGLGGSSSVNAIGLLGPSGSTGATVTGTGAGSGGILAGVRNALGITSKPTTGELVRRGLNVANDIEQGRMADRSQQNQQNLVDYALHRNDAITNANAPANFSRQVVLGDILHNLQPFTYDNKTGAMTGGLGPWVLGENSRASGEALSKQALDRQLSNNPYNLPAIPTRVTGNGVDTALNILGNVGTGIDAYNAAGQPNQSQSDLATLMRIFGRSPGAQTQQPGPAAPSTPTTTRAPRPTYQPSTEPTTPAPINGVTFGQPASNRPYGSSQLSPNPIEGVTFDPYARAGQPRFRNVRFAF